ncbi:AraC family transcriptional regulator [Streptomyces broussonetiae]|uniref:Helix-turn-helix domain-containing protein n=1 Tax=Streptomyces broussonetiae TaxID=2686304 RepID=A0A6I6N473_9ACTN|nr:helix-turn-helix domain-containing protein [Streptomyces broussonetiae]QHA07573.1 helix-turn-helix domain-containing protein [Streptomyces broussonetiae]
MPNAIAEQDLATPEVLRPWIAGVRTLSVSLAEPADKPFVHLPAAVTKVVLRVGADGRRDVLASGPRVRASYHSGKAHVRCVELRLTPGMTRPLLGVHAAELVGRVVPLEGLPGTLPRRLAAGLRRLDPLEAVPYLTETLPGLLAAVVDPARTALLRAGVDALSVRPDRTPAQVREVARELAVSERQLRNLFAEGVGVSPKHYARIDRVRTVVTRAGHAPWSQLAAATGYFDQSHMTSDFRALMGVPPRSYFTGRLPALTPCRSVPRF